MFRRNGFLLLCLMVLVFLAVTSADAYSMWLSSSVDCDLQVASLSKDDLDMLVWSKTAGPHPQGYVVRRDGTSQPITMQVAFELADRLAYYDQVDIAGFVSKPDLGPDNLPVLLLRWIRRSEGERDRWQLQLIAKPGLLPEHLIDETTPQLEIANLSLPVGYPRQGEIYTAVLSFDPTTGEVHVALQDDPEAIFPLEFAANLQIGPVSEILYPMSGWEGQNLQGLVRDSAYVIHELNLHDDFVDDGLPLEIQGEVEFFLINSEGQRYYGSTYYHDQQLLASLIWPKAYIPGEIRLTFVHEGLETEMFSAKWASDKQVFSLPLGETVPLGQALLRLDYILNGRVSTISKQEVRIIENRVAARFELYGRNYRRAAERAHLPIQDDPGIYGNVVITHDRPLQDALLEVSAVYTSDNQETQNIAVLSTTIASAQEDGQITIPFEFDLPKPGGQLRILAELKAAGIASLAVEESIKVWPAPLVPAFPGAEGFGAFTPGGRGGRVIRVTNLDDAGPGSFRAAVEAEGSRTVIFDVSGIIELESRLVISNPYITIAGQTAPGGGITIANYPTQITAHDVILRHMRFRMGDLTEQQEDTLEIKGQNVIVDHVSATWGIDETLSVTDADKVTVQWSLIAHSLNRSIHDKGAHGYGSLIRGGRGAAYSFHHNLWAHHRSRMPRPGNYLDHKLDPVGLLADFRNNVIYNWEGSYPGANYDTDSISKYNFINNYYLPGMNSGDTWAFRDDCPYAQAYFAGNSMDGQLPEDPWSLVRGVGPWTEGYKLENELLVAPVSTESAVSTFDQVLAKVGAQPRDQVDEAIVWSVLHQTGEIINSQAQVGGWPMVKMGSAPTDLDQDGIPDWWEEKHGLDPRDSSDALHMSKCGYTYLELYLNSLCDGY